MTKTSFSLDEQVKGPVKDCPVPAQVSVPLSGHSTKTVKKKAEVAPGSPVAEHTSAEIGDMHSPVFGTVSDVKPGYVLIDVAEVEAQAETVSTQGLEGKELKSALKRLGINARLLRKAETLVVNGLNPEPGVSLATQLFQDYAQTLNKGLETAKLATGASSCQLVTSSAGSASLDGCTTVSVKAAYPASVDELAVKAATGRETSESVCVLSALDIYLIGKAVETGLPVTETIVSVNGENYLAKVGTPSSEVLAAAGVSLADGDHVILGGPMRGVGIQDLSQGLPKNAMAVTVVGAKDFPPVTDLACLNCGMCVKACPARLMPNMISRYAEFEMWENARTYGIDACFECGMCGFWCTGRRPLLQYIRLAKERLEKMDADLASCALTE